jgi:hypothetical protein
MGPVAEQHAIGGGEGQDVAAALLPAEVARPGHDLLGLDPGELGEGTVRGLVAPDALGRREHGVAAVALLVVAVVLIAVDHDLVADVPAGHLGADRPDDAGGIGAGDVVVRLVHVEDRDRLAERGPDAVVVDHLVAVDDRGVHDLDLHGGLGLAVALAPDGPGVHSRRHVTQGRDLAELVEVLAGRSLRECLGFRGCRLGHGLKSPKLRGAAAAVAPAAPGVGSA